ncbi:MAG: carboxynorspermidine decarboxylase [Velocimicrobium sp.]
MDYSTIKTPAFVVEEALLIKNLERLAWTRKETGCHILLAQKCFSMYAAYPLIGTYLDGTTASGLYEAKLGYEYMGKENHIYAAAYREDEMDEILSVCDHIVFNSHAQWNRYKKKAIAAKVQCGLRINPEFSTQEGHAIYDPCAPYSRMGITRENFLEEELEGISGLHFHTLCEQNSEDLKTTLNAVEEKFGSVLSQMKWINFGGGQHITKDDYDMDTLITCIKHMQTTYGLTVYLEPGEAVALNAGFLVSSVLDVVQNGKKIAILDASAACHMPDVLEMPYTPAVIGAKIVTGEDVSINRKLEYRLAGPTCLAGDVIGDYDFEKPLQIGDRVVFCDMAIYSMVKTNTFNGMKLPDIVYKKGTSIEILKNFGYEDFKSRL